jgi:hypothetical protein
VRSVREVCRLALPSRGLSIPLCLTLVTQLMHRHFTTHCVTRCCAMSLVISSCDDSAFCSVTWHFIARLSAVEQHSVDHGSTPHRAVPWQYSMAHHVIHLLKERFLAPVAKHVVSVDEVLLLEALSVLLYCASPGI